MDNSNLAHYLSYSTAKSAFVMALIRLRQKYITSVYDLLVKDYIPETTASIGTWTKVDFNSTIDLATTASETTKDSRGTTRSMG